MLIKKWNSLSLIVRICIGLVIGAVLGLLLPGWTWIGVLGTLLTWTDSNRKEIVFHHKHI